MRKLVSVVSAIALTLGGCGGGGSGTTTGGSGGGITPSPSPGPSATCSLSSRQAWALSTLQEWYLFPETLATTANPASFNTVESYIDALTANARAQGKDRFFTFLTSIAEENAFNTSGSTAGFGIRISYDVAGRRAFISESFEGAPALAAGIDRSDEIIGVGTTANDIRLVSDIIAASGARGVSDALGPSDAGVTRVLRVRSNGVTRDVTVTKADFNLLPVSTRYGSRIIDSDGRRIGYINLRTFILSAHQPLRDAFASFRAQGVTEFIIDFRYNGGGLIATADVIGDLLGGGRSSNEIWEQTTYRPSKSSNNNAHRFNPGASSVQPTKIAFIGTSSTASASELVINSTLPYFGNNVSLVGGNSFGKPVGQIAIDRAQCDDRLRVVAFSFANARGESGFFNGLASTLPNSCIATDDVTFPLGDAREASVKGAIDFIAGRPCATGPIPPTTAGTASVRAVAGRMVALMPERPSAAQIQVPGLF